MAYYKKTRHNMYSCFSLMVRFNASVTQLYRRTYETFVTIGSSGRKENLVAPAVFFFLVFFIVWLDMFSDLWSVVSIGNFCTYSHYLMPTKTQHSPNSSRNAPHTQHKQKQKQCQSCLWLHLLQTPRKEKKTTMAMCRRENKAIM